MNPLTPMPQPRLTVAADINAYTGYGLHGIQIIRDLERITGAFISVRALSRSEQFGARIPVDISQKFVQQVQAEEWELLLHPPNFAPTPGKKTAYFTMWEATKLPPMGIDLLNQVAVVIVPCIWNASCFSACGVTAPIRVVPLGIHPNIFRYRPAPPTGNCVFGTAGRLAHGGVRKGVNEIIELFYRAFPDEADVELHVKGFPDCNVIKTLDPRVKITQAYLTDPQVSDWFAGLNCFVSGAKAEGWGLMQHQAMATGVPIISVNFGGVSEFFSDKVGYPVDYTLELAQHAYAGCGHWAQPSDESIIAHMRHVYHNRTEAFAKGAEAARSVKHLTWDRSNHKLTHVLKEFGAL